MTKKNIKEINNIIKDKDFKFQLMDIILLSIEYGGEDIPHPDRVDEFVQSIYEIILTNLNWWKRALVSISFNGIFDNIILKEFSLKLDEYERCEIYQNGKKIGITKFLR